jgi:Flp pilus assembly protein TadD
MSRTRAGVLSFLFLSLFLCLLAMFVVSFRPGEETPAARTPERGAVSREAGAVRSPPADGQKLPDRAAGLALTEKEAEDLTALMRRLQANPTDPDVLAGLGGTFLMAGEWARAEVFLNRAVLSRPADIQPRYMLGICLFQQGKFQEAQRAYEDLLAIREDPPAMYNLALLYKYHLDNSARAKQLLQKIVDSPATDADTLEKAKKELAGDG